MIIDPGQRKVVVALAPRPRRGLWWDYSTIVEGLHYLNALPQTVVTPVWSLKCFLSTADTTLLSVVVSLFVWTEFRGIQLETCVSSFSFFSLSRNKLLGLSLLHGCLRLFSCCRCVIFLVICAWTTCFRTCILSLGLRVSYIFIIKCRLRVNDGHIENDSRIQCSYVDFAELMNDMGALAVLHMRHALS